MKTAARIRTLRVVKAGAYTTITSINAPASAIPGSLIDITVTIKNTFVVALNIACFATAGSQSFIDTTSALRTVQPGQSAVFTGSYVTMPGNSLVVDAYSYYEDTGGALVPDDSLEISIAVQQPANPPALQVLNSPITSGQALQFQFSGFLPNESVQVYVAGGGGITVTSDGSGAGSGSFVDNDPTANYLLVAKDSSGNIAEVIFTVQAPAVTSWQKLATQNVSLGAPPASGWQNLQQTQVNLGVQVAAGWQKLTTRNVNVGLQVAGGWTKLASQNAGVGLQVAAGWQKLTSQNAAVAVQSKLSGGWQKVATQNTLLQQGFQIPASYKLVLSETTPDGKSYSGAAQRSYCSFGFLPSNWPGAQWFTQNLIVNKLSDQAQQNGVKLLTAKLYEDGFAYILVMETSNPATTYRALAQAVIAAIVIAALVLAIAITLTVLVHLVTDFIYNSPGAAISVGLIALGIAGAGLLGIAIWKGTSVKEAVTGKKPSPKPATAKALVASR